VGQKKHTNDALKTKKDQTKNDKPKNGEGNKGGVWKKTPANTRPSKGGGGATTPAHGPKWKGNKGPHKPSTTIQQAMSSQGGKKNKPKRGQRLWTKYQKKKK